MPRLQISSIDYVGIDLEFLNGQPATGSFQGRVKPLDAGMAFPSDSQSFEGSRTDAVPDEDVLLPWMCRRSAKSHVTDLVGLGTTAIQTWVPGEHILGQFTEPCHIARRQH